MSQRLYLAAKAMRLRLLWWSVASLLREGFDCAAVCEAALRPYIRVGSLCTKNLNLAESDVCMSRWATIFPKK
jgi:hypothetical protein